MKFDKLINIFATPSELAEKFAEDLTGRIEESARKRKPVTIVLSGGSTPELLFAVLGERYSETVPWKYVHFFWGDERCVPLTNPDSNFGNAKRIFLDRIDIPLSNIHRIRGEDDSEEEVERYAREILSVTLLRDWLPLFDITILGLGEDGHTASIFPGNPGLLNSDKICETAFHPVSNQKRITLTGRVINNSESVAFLVTGKKKAAVVEKILRERDLSQNCPASHIVPVYGKIRWFLDKESGSLL
jgi:6-phosphogluconolactonase